jgi:hypothetical protein
MLLRAGVKYGSRNVLADPDIREGVKAFSKWPTIPQAGHAGPSVKLCCTHAFAVGSPCARAQDLGIERLLWHGRCTSRASLWAAATC